TCGPDDRVAVELGAVGEHHVPVLERLGQRVQVHLDAALLQLHHRVHTQALAHLGQNPPGRLDQHPAQVARVDVLVVPGGEPGHVLQLGQRLDAGETTTDEGER